VVSGSVMLGSASRMHRGKVGRDVAVDGASVGVGAGASVSGNSSSMVSVSVGAGGRTKAGLRS